MLQLKPFVTQDQSSGILHLRIATMRADGEVRSWRVRERCQADQSGSFDVLSIEEARSRIVSIREGQDEDGIRKAICDWCVDDIDELTATP